MVKTCEIFRYIFQNFNHNETIFNFQTAVYNYHEKLNGISDIHTILFQLLVSTFALTINEAKVLLRIYMGPNTKIDYDQLFSEQLKYPRQETLNYNKEKSSYRSQLMNIKANLEEMYYRKRNYKPNLIILEESIGSKKYINIILKKSKIIENCNINYNNDWLFQQDNAPAHRAQRTHKFLNDKNVSVLSCPPYSPDLNIIELVWAIMKNRIDRRNIQSID